MTAVTALVGVVFGIAPALQATRIDIGTSLKESSRSVTGSNNILSRGLLVAQVSISLVLLVGAGLFLRTLDNLKRVDIGYDPNNLVFVRTLPKARPSSTQRIEPASFSRAWSGSGPCRACGQATVSMPTLLSGGANGTGMFVQGRVHPTGRVTGSRSPSTASSSRRIFSRRWEFHSWPAADVTEHDHAKAPKVAVINQAAARKFFPNENPIGRRFGTSAETSGDIEIVGVLRDVHYNSLREAPPPTMYVPYRAARAGGLIFTVRTAGDPAALMPAIRRGGERHQSRDSSRHGRDADVSDRAEVCPGEGSGAGIHALRRHRGVRRRHRAVRVDVVQRVAAHAGNRHSHRDGRAASRGARPGRSRVAGARHRGNRRSASASPSRAANMSRRSCLAWRRPISRRCCLRWR